MQKPKIMKVKPSDLIIDLRVQRPLDDRRVRAIAKELNVHAIGTICVSKRDNGDLVVIDGGHRTSAMILAGKGDVLISAEVYEGLSLADEATLFRHRNNTQKVGYLDRFRVRLVEGEEIALNVQKLANKYGWGVISDDHLPMLHSVKKLEQVYRRDEFVADKILEVISGSWGHLPTAVDYRIIGGLDMFLHRYWDDFDTAVLIRRLADYAGGPEDLISRAQGLSESLRGTHASAIAELITDQYNKGKRHNGSRLPAWRV